MHSRLSLTLYSSEQVLNAITQIRTRFGAASISCGVLHHGEVIFTHGDGLANVEKGLAPDPLTIYPVASNTKAFITALCGILVDEGRLSWDEPVSNILPRFNPVHDPEIGRRATLRDLCSHGCGLAPLDNAGCGFHDQFLNPGHEGVHIASHLPVAYDFRAHWLYNNFLLGVVGDLIAAVEGKRSGEVLRDRILQPLNMTRTFSRNDEYSDDNNAAKGYAVLDSGELLPLEPPDLQDCGLQGASGYVRSCVRDMLVWAKAVMQAESAEVQGSSPEKPNPLRQMSVTRSAMRPIVNGLTGLENSYGLGWFRHMLPSTFLGSIGPNFALLPEPPVINRDGPPRLTVAHWGEFGGFLSSFYTFPDTCSAIIVLANTPVGTGDPTDLIAQTLCQELFNMRPRVKLEDFAAQAASTANLIWRALVEEWVQNRVQNTHPSPLEDLTGTYTNTGLKLTIYVTQIPPHKVGSGPNPELLTFNINRMKKQTANLRHYHYDTWTFLPDSRDDAVRKGMLNFIRLSTMLMSFVRDEKGAVTSLCWDLQGGVCEGPAPNLKELVTPVCFTKV
ncbi:hypothetical protein A1O3_09392 [Capronia epimyces CBS 606.96]|uniref:Beta-lactamase-related domain-containing protein n=1 Tax=Capronia epimyces CBS 606.96 TaxID=1182542 RepID=W9XMN2_9EURO|nr:uncharacterized protein A1O3_09392 [Capronia epimyces CBS 606.96]EXJ78231.1 hypothetical protein A1O3_09392 [Capronia epimyces CBS 606.96]